MIRGINKRVIEISKMDSPYFERAILFVKNEPDAAQARIMSVTPAEMVRQLTMDYHRTPGVRVWLSVARYLGCAAAGWAWRCCFYIE
jgi:hypothetical protein